MHSRSSRAYTSVHYYNFLKKKLNAIFYLVKFGSTLLWFSVRRLASSRTPVIQHRANHDYRATRPRNRNITRRIRKFETDYLRCRNKASHGVMCRHKDSSSALTVSFCGSSLSSAVNEECFLKYPDHIAWPSPSILATWRSGRLWPRYLSLVWLWKDYTPVSSNIHDCIIMSLFESHESICEFWGHTIDIIRPF